jgi:hypothetical protein
MEGNDHRAGGTITSGGRSYAGGAIRPISGWRGDLHPTMRDPTTAELARRCPFCGQVPGPSATGWCPSFDELLQTASRSA